MDRLVATLDGFKEGAPDVNTLLVAAAPEIAYVVVIRVLDRTQPSFPNVSFVVAEGSE